MEISHHYLTRPSRVPGADAGHVVARVPRVTGPISARSYLPLRCWVPGARIKPLRASLVASRAVLVGRDLPESTLGTFLAAFLAACPVRSRPSGSRPRCPDWLPGGRFCRFSRRSPGPILAGVTSHKARGEPSHRTPVRRTPVRLHPRAGRARARAENGDLKRGVKPGENPGNFPEEKPIEQTR